MDIGSFRTSFPEFSDTTVYPNTMVTFWAGLAEKLVLSSIWRSCRTQGVELYVAHSITIAAQNAKAAAVGGTPGVSGGIANNKTVGSVTVGYDAQVSSEKDAGYWNLTTYGKQFIRLARIFGAGCFQL